jgi:uncharacterized protein GlcG (DUF336 family)
MRTAGRLFGIFTLSVVALVACKGPTGSSDSTVVTDVANPQVVAASDPAPPPLTTLSAADVTAVVAAAVNAVVSTSLVVAVVDREGVILGVYRQAGAPATVAGNFGAAVNANDFAISLARTGAFFSNDEAPLSSRTVRFISGIHFPPGIQNKPNAELYGIENTNRGCLIVTPGDPVFNVPALNQHLSLGGVTCNSFDQSGCGLGIATGKANLIDSDSSAVAPGGVPIFKNGRVVGGVGVTGVGPDLAEFAAFKGSTPSAAFGPVAAAPGVIFIDGIALPFVNNTNPPPGAGSGSPFDASLLITGPIPSPRGVGGVPDGYLIGPAPAGANLTISEVDKIVGQAIAQALKTRAAIRLPPSRPAKMVIAVSDLTGAIVALYRMPDATIFSIDVAVTKARNVIYFSGPTRVAADLPGVPINTAVTNRTISFGAQPLFPPGIENSGPGPFFTLYQNDVKIPCRQGSEAPNIRQSGIVFFPGSTPLYKNGILVGGLGVSGDGVAQDDLVAAAGATGFAPPANIRADQIFINDVRLPFFKFPQNPELL